MKLNKTQKDLINRTQKIYDNLKTKKEKEKHEKMLVSNYLSSTNNFLIECYIEFAKKNNITLPKKQF